MTSRGSLSIGENKSRRAAGAGSSPAPLTRSERSRLWRRLRNYDRKITELDRKMVFSELFGMEPWTLSPDVLWERRTKWDERRKEVRRKLKGGGTDESRERSQTRQGIPRTADG